MRVKVENMLKRGEEIPKEMLDEWDLLLGAFWLQWVMLVNNFNGKLYTTALVYCPIECVRPWYELRGDQLSGVRTTRWENQFDISKGEGVKSFSYIGQLFGWLANQKYESLLRQRATNDQHLALEESAGFHFPRQQMEAGEDKITKRVQTHWGFRERGLESVQLPLFPRQEHRFQGEWKCQWNQNRYARKNLGCSKNRAAFELVR